jgi:hypothetical protein
MWLAKTRDQRGAVRCGHQLFRRWSALQPGGLVFKDRENADEIKSLINRFRELNNHRQRVAHGLWVPFLQGGSVHYTARSSLRSTSYPKQADALEVLANEALNLRNELSEAITGIGIYFQSVEDTQGYEPED